MARPRDPARQTLLWLGYWAGTNGPLSLLLSGALLAFGGGFIVTAAWPIGLICIVVGAAIPALRLYWERQGEALDDTVTAREKLLEEALRPLLERAASAVSMSKNDREGAADRAAEKAVNDLYWAFGTVPGVRTVVFGISDDGKRMAPLYTAGRAQRPGDFVDTPESPRGAKAFAVLDGKDPYTFIADLDKEDAEEWAGTGEGYRTFITAPIRSLEEGYGLLTIDATNAGTLDKRHATTVALFAAALGVLFAEAARGSVRPGTLVTPPSQE